MKWQRAIAIVLLGLVIAFVLVDQPPDRGFAKGHRGWVTAHVLAQIARAKFDNGFVGYTLKFVDAAGASSYYYFDRYPVFFSAAMHAALHMFDLSLGNQIYLARELMNVLYGLILVAGAGLLMEVQIAPGIAVASAAMAGTGHYMVSYRDMVHFDQPAMVGFMFLLWAIARWYRTRDSRLVYIAAGLAVLMGRGYASFAVLGCWWILEAVRTVRADYRHAPRLVALGVQTRACVLGIALAGSCLAYNVATEARISNIPISEVGIVASATRRLSLDETFNKKKARTLAWSSFSNNEASRGFKGIQPYGMFFYSPSGGELYFSVALVFAVIGIFSATRTPEIRAPLILMTVSGLAWLFPMKGLTAFHDYTTMYMYSLYLAFFASVLSLVPARAQLVPALMACACLVYCTHSSNLSVAARQSKGEAITADFERIARNLKRGDAVRIIPKYAKLLPGIPYALGFYLPDSPILTSGLSRFAITKNKWRTGKNRTPENRYFYLFRTKNPA